MYIEICSMQSSFFFKFGFRKSERLRLARRIRAISQRYETRANLLATRPAWMWFRTNHHTGIDFGRGLL
jgi:hypothetical protein